MKNKGFTKAFKKDRLIIAALCVVVVLLFIFCVNAFEGQDAAVLSGTTAENTAVPDVAAVTEKATTVAVDITETTATPIQTTAPVDETAEILKVVTDSVNKLKAEGATFSGHKVQNINIELVDSSVPSMNGFVNSIIKAFVKEEIYDYNFVNGVADDPENGGTSASNDIFPPESRAFSLTKEGVASVRKTVDGANTVYTVVLVAEASTLENPRPPHHNSCADTLDLSTIEIPLVTIDKADFDYPGAEISVTLDPDGKVIAYHEYLRISGMGQASGLGITGYGTIEGHIDEKWDIIWK